MQITDYISAEMRKPFLPGDTDCANTADRWFKLQRGFSALQNFGRPVRNADDMAAWLNEPRGLVGGLYRVMRKAGVRVTVNPVAGDVGIIVVGNRACIALYNGETWFSRDEDGYIVADDTYRYAAWSVG